MGRQILRNWSKISWLWLSNTFNSMIMLEPNATPAGWWFGTWISFFHSVGNFIIPTDFHSIVFQRGGEKLPTSYGECPRLEKNLTNSSLSSIGGALKTVRGPSHCGAACDLPFMLVKHFLFFTYFYHPWLGMVSIYHLWWWLGDGKHDIV